MKSNLVVDTLVDVGDYRLHFRVLPGSEPTVLLESGGGADATYWDALTPILARETGATIVAYDRAGYGESDLPHGAPRPQLRELPPEPGQLPNLKALDWPLTDWQECRQKLSSGPI